jgi:hypothetical protein
VSTVTLDVSQWAEEQSGQCDFGHKRRTDRLVQYGAQAAANPDGYGKGAKNGGKTVGRATEDEIWDCILKCPMAKDYATSTYNCHNWVSDALKAAGLIASGDAVAAP